MKLENNGFGKFHATNGVDEIEAVYERGKKGADGQFHPGWHLTSYGKTKTYYVGKNEIEELVRKLLTEPISQPLTREESLKMQEDEGCVHGIVAVALCDVIDHSLDEFLDLLNDKLTECLLDDTNYHVVAVADDGQTLHIRYSGYAEFED